MKMDPGTWRATAHDRVPCCKLICPGYGLVSNTTERTKTPGLHIFNLYSARGVLCSDVCDPEREM